jgi:iron complex outermembrane receptor protein
VSTSFETPTTTELVNRPTGPGGFNPELNPQKATTFEIGARGVVTQRFAFDVAGFVADVRDALIPFEVPTDPDRRFFRNAGSSTHRGIEISATLRPADPVTVTTAYTVGDYQFDEFRTDTEVFDGNRIPGVPVHNWYASVRAQTAFGLWFAADNTVASSMFMNDANTVESEGYVTTAIRVGYDYSADGWRVAPFLTILNVFDESYVSSAVVNGAAGRFFEPAPGRNMYAGVEIRWR